MRNASGKQEETSMVKMSDREKKRAGTQAKSYAKMLEMIRTLFCVILLVCRMRFRSFSGGPLSPFPLSQDVRKSRSVFFSSRNHLMREKSCCKELENIYTGMGV